MSTTEFSALETENDIRVSGADYSERGEEGRQNQSFGQMFQDAKEYLSGEGGTRILSNLTAQVRDNPLPFALVGVGLAWLFTGSRLPHLSSGSSFGRGYDRDQDDDFDEAYGFDDEFDADAYEGRGDLGGDTGVYTGASHPDYSGTSYGEADEWTEEHGEYSSGRSGRGGVLRRAGGAVSGAAGSVGSAVTGAASGAAGAASSVAGSVGDTAASVAGGVTSAVGSVASGVASAASSVGRGAYSAVGSVASGARYGGTQAYRGVSRFSSGAFGGASDLGSRARQGMSDVMQADPLILGAMGIAAGATLGALLPRTRVEDEYLGETRDHLIDEAEHLARQTYQQGKNAAQEALRTAKSEASTLAGTGEGSIIGKVSEVARATYDRVKEGEGTQGGSGMPGSGESQAGGGSSAGGTTATSFGETGSQGTAQTQGGQSSSESTGGAL